MQVGDWRVIYKDEMETINKFFEGVSTYLIQQVKEWGEILVGFETKNKYEILSTEQQQIGFMAEKSQGFLAVLARQFFRSHRPLEVVVYNADREIVMKLSRKFFFFFSDLTITDKNGLLIGHVHRRFGVLYKKYDLCDARNIVFSTIKSPLWRLWKFPVYDSMGNEVGAIKKNWGGLLKEMFTDADKFQVDFPAWENEKKAVIFAAAVSIDFDFFDDNQAR